MQDRPTAIELIKAAQEFCERDLMPQLSGRLGFHTRVLRNVLGILEREWESEEEAVRAEWERLGRLLDTSEDPPASFAALLTSVRERNTDLATRIRSGAIDERWDEAVEAVYETVAEKLAIANPNYSEAASSDT